MEVTKVFNHAYELATWINLNIEDWLIQEQVMMHVLETKKRTGKLTLTLKVI